MKKPKGFFTYFHLSTVIDKLSDAQAGRLYKALMRYGSTGETADFSDDLACDMAFTLMKGEIDVNFERYAELCERNRENAKKGGAPAGNRNAAKNNRPVEKQPKTKTKTK